MGEETRRFGERKWVMKLMKIDAVSDVSSLGTLDRKTIKEFQKWMDSGNSGQPVQACWMGASETWDGESNKIVHKPQLKRIDYYCLRQFNNVHQDKTVPAGFMMKFTNKSGRPKTVKFFYDYLFSDDSPWRTSFPGLALVGEDKNGIPDAILWYDTGASPSKHVANLLSAIRLHTCWGLDIVWSRLVDAGFSPEEAILLASNFSFDGQSITVSNGPVGLFDEDVFSRLSLSKMGCSKTDMPFSTNYNPSGFKPLLVDKRARGDLGALTDKTGVQPNNYIWHEDEIEVNADNLNKSSPEYKNRKISVSSNITTLQDYLTRKSKTLSLSYVHDVSNKLINNEFLEI